MNQKERLVEVLKNAHDEQKYLTSDKSINAIADYILADGWMRPPCKVGDTVYAIFENTIKELYVKYINIPKNDIEIVAFPKDENKFGYSFGLNKLGKTLFTSREDAEKALRGGDVECI